MKIYLATPYSDPSPEVRELRFLEINIVAAKLIALGHTVFSPISHSHPIALAGDLPLGHRYWGKSDRSFLDWADELWVYLAPGWSSSKGLLVEVKYAKTRNLPVRYLDKELSLGLIFKPSNQGRKS